MFLEVKIHSLHSRHTLNYYVRLIIPTINGFDAYYMYLIAHTHIQTNFTLSKRHV